MNQTRRSAFTLIEMLARPAVVLRTGRRQSRSAFTLIEMLVVIAIIALLLTLIFPTASSAIDRAKATACKSNMRQLGLAVMAFAGDHEGRLPGAYANSADPNVRGGGPFVGKEVLIPEASYTMWLYDPNTVGSLSEYLNIENGDARRFYRCPALKFTGLDTGVGSNGMFDYKYVKAFGGVPIQRIPATSILDHDYVMYTLPTPIILEEDPKEHGNNYYIDPGFSNADRLGTWHPGLKGHYIAIDGSVQTFTSKRDGEGPRCFSWKAGGNPDDYHNTGTPFWDSNISYGQWKRWN